MSQLKTFELELRKKSLGSALSIIGFIVIYLLMILFTISLTLGLGYAALSLMIVKLNYITVILAISVGAMGLVILKYLFSFINREKVEEKTVEIEITESEQAKFFALLREITSKVGTRMPKKVFITPDVNASVQFNSNFWSLFWPSRKNLKIGWGLVNGVNATELKFILAHEFGHFSQGSMVLGSYTYQVNQVLGALLFGQHQQEEKEGISSLISIAENIGKGIVEIMESTLRHIFKIVNQKYLSLSRQMEFHADAVAGSIYGPEGQRYSLIRSHFIQSCIDLCLGFYNSGKGNLREPANVYLNQRQVQKFLIAENGLNHIQGWAIIKSEHENDEIKSRLQFYEDWSSHPTEKERVESLNRFFRAEDFPSPEFEPATQLFENTIEIETQLCDAWLPTLQYDLGAKDKITEDFFAENFEGYYRQRRYHAVYNDYYDFWEPRELPVEDELLSNNQEQPAFESLFTNERRWDTLKILGLEQDLSVLQSIASKNFEVRRFKYQDKNYKALQVGEIAQPLKKEIEDLAEKAVLHDKAIFHYFYREALNRNQEKNYLEHLRAWRSSRIYLSENELHFAAEYIDRLSFTQEETPFETIRKNFKELEAHDKKLRIALKADLLDENLSSLLSAEGKKLLEDFLNSNAIYFEGKKYDDEKLSLLIGSLQVYLQLILPEKESLAKSELLRFQTSFIDPSKLKLAQEERKKNSPALASP